MIRIGTDRTNFVERFIGSLRRECLNHVIVLLEGHLKRIVEDYLDDYHDCRKHLVLDRNVIKPSEPITREKLELSFPSQGWAAARMDRVESSVFPKNRAIRSRP